MLGLSGSGLMGKESDKTVENFKLQTGATFPLVLEDETRKKFGRVPGSISPYPLDVIIDQQGIIRYVGTKFERDAMVEVIDKLLAK